MSERGPATAAAPPGLAELAGSFLRIALASFGGGLSAWSRQVIVEDKRWLDDEEFLSAYTLCRLLPGPNQVNLAIYVGARFAGPAGAAAALGGLVVVPLAIVIALGIGYFHYDHLPDLQRLLRGAAAAATGMALSMGVKVGLPYLHRLDALLLAAAAFVGVEVLRWPLVWVVLGLAPLGVAWFWPRGEGADGPPSPPKTSWRWRAEQEGARESSSGRGRSRSQREPARGSRR